METIGLNLISQKIQKGVWCESCLIKWKRTIQKWFLTRAACKDDEEKISRVGRILWMVLLVFKGIALVADLAAKFCCTLHTSTHHFSLMYDSEMKHTLVMDREVYNGHHYSAHWWGFIFLKDMFVFLSLRCFSQMIFLERFSSLLIFPSPSTLILAISNIKVSFYLPGA